jgi:hypothetical protein
MARSAKPTADLKECKYIYLNKGEILCKLTFYFE